MKNNNYINKKKKGMSLVEIVIVLAISVVVLGTMYSLLTGTTKSRVNQEVTSTLQKEAADIQDELVKLGSQSKKMNSINGVDTGTINYANTLINDGKDDKVKSVDIVNFKYHNDNEWQLLFSDNDGDGIGEISINYPDGTYKIIATHVSQLKIRPIDVNTVADTSTAKFNNSKGVEFIIELRMKKGYSDVTSKFSVIVKFRNKDI